MHIAMVSPFPESLDRIVGGVAGVARYLVAELVSQGHRVTVIDTTPQKGQHDIQEMGGITVHRLGSSRKVRVPLAYEFFSRPKQLDSVFETLKPDIVHFQGLSCMARGCRWPNVVTLHGIPEKDAMWTTGRTRYLKSMAYRLAEGIGRRKAPNLVLISRYVDQFLSPNAPDQKRWLIENPIQSSYFDLENNPVSQQVFVCGSIIQRKNVLGSLEAFKTVHEAFPEATLRFAGTADADYMERCREYIRVNGLGDVVHFLGSLSVNAVQEELRNAWCLLLPSFQETAPVAIEEAMAVGVPVIASDVGGVAQMIDDEETGFIVDPHDSSSIARSLLKLLGDRTLQKTMGNRAKQVAKGRFHVSIIAQQTLDMYSEILNKSGPS